MLVHNINSMANRLKYEFENLSSRFHHNSIIGSLREEVLKNCMRELIPSKYSIGTGIAIDAYDTQSKQQDFLIYDGFSSPKFLQNEALVVLPVESVYATVEVKSKLNLASLKLAVNNAQSINALQKSILYPQKPLQYVEPSNRIMSCLFAYSSDTSLLTIQRNFDTLNEHIPFGQRISIICVLDKGCIVTVEKDNINTIIIWPHAKTRTIIRPNSLEQNLYLFYLILQTGLSLVISYPPDLVKYATINKSLQSKIVRLHTDTIPKGESFVLDGISYAGNDIQRVLHVRNFLDGKIPTDQEVRKSGLSRDDLSKEISWAKDWIAEKNRLIHESLNT